jgi:hypothetical protein
LYLDRFPRCSTAARAALPAMSLIPFAPFSVSAFSLVLLIADLFHPVDRFAVERFLNGYMSHRSRRRSAVPVHESRRDEVEVESCRFAAIYIQGTLWMN